MWFHLRLLEQCNLKCESCYAQNHDRSEIMSFELFKKVLEAIKGVLKNRKNMSVIYLSGGEPLLHPDFFEMLEYCFSQFDRVSILTNGLLVKKNIEKFLPYKDKLCIQVSLDGNEEINDKIRGRGVYKIATEALQILDENKLKHWFSFTVSQTNKHCFKDVLEVAKHTNSFFNNVTPYTGDPELMLDYLEWKEFKYNYEKTTIEFGMESAHGPNCCGFNYNCSEFHSGVTINPDGSLAGCARINNIKGSYIDMNKFIQSGTKLISQACMKTKWGIIENFGLIKELE